MEKQIYLSDFEDYKQNGLPSNCVFNKVATGCGGTTLEIENMNRDSIIAVPLEQMINNKVNQYPNTNGRTPTDFKMFGVKAGITKYDIIEFLKTNKVHKIITTYDSLYKVIEAINELNESETKQRKLKDYFLLIDEVHYIMNNYKLRKNAIKRLMEAYKLFDKWCFMTATPNEPEFMLDELKDIPLIIAPFELELIKIENVRTIQVEATTKKVINDYLTNRLQNAHIFVNSVEIIARLIKACELTNDNCRAVWSTGNKSYKNSVQGIVRSEVGSEAKKINFYTSTCFEGSDISDIEGQYIIVSDGSKAYTLNDISTSFRQILGRLRNTKYRSEALHIFKETRYNNYKTFEEYKNQTNILKEDANIFIETYNKVSDLSKSKITEDELNEKYITKINGVYQIDNNLISYDLNKYKLAMQTYSTIAIVKEEQEKNSFKSVNTLHRIEPTDLLKTNKTKKVKFNDAFEQYVTLKNETTPNKDFLYSMVSKTDEERFSLLESAYDIMKDAYNILGVEEVRNLKYNQTNIKRKIIACSDSTQENKIARILSNEGVRRNEFISLEDCKSKIQNAYDTLKIKKTAKGSDLEKYFIIELNTRMITKKKKEGEIYVKIKKMVKGYVIVKEKFIFIQND